jgi:hypothetical protein
MEKQCKKFKKSELYDILEKGKEQKIHFLNKKNIPIKCIEGKGKLFLTCDEGHIFKYFLIALLKDNPQQIKPTKINLHEMAKLMESVANRLNDLGHEIQLIWDNKKKNISNMIYDSHIITKHSNEIMIGGELTTATIFTIVGALGALIKGIYYIVTLYLENRKTKNMLHYDMTNIINIISTKIKTVDDILNFGSIIDQHILLYRYISNLLYKMQQKLNNIKEQKIDSDTICICDSKCSSIIHKFKDNLKKAVEIKAINSDILQFIIDVEK